MAEKQMKDGRVTNEVCERNNAFRLVADDSLKCRRQVKFHSRANYRRDCKKVIY